MNSVPTILEHLRRQNVSVHAEGDYLLLEAPRGAVTAAVREVLMSHKPEILANLRAQGKHTPEIPGTPRETRTIGITGLSGMPPALNTNLDIYRYRIRQAASWDALSFILDDAQSAYVSGELSADEVDALADACRVAADALPIPDHGW